jgi:arylformamidase
VIYDLSPPIDSRLAVWPGDTPPRRDVLLDIGRGDNITLSSLTSTVHLGAHADAPSHYGANGPGIDQRQLDLYLGPCQLIRVNVPRRHRVAPADLPGTIRAPRVLLATGSFPDPCDFNKDFAALAPELLDCLAGQGVRLIGLDTPSVDLFDSKDLPSHHAALKHDLALLEGLVLAEVPEGLYELIALPLRLVDFDASPVRAVLRSLG